jgi:hypothetical protein
MNKIVFIIISVLLIGGLFGCSTSKPYSFKETINKGDVVFIDPTYSNIEKFDRFLTNLGSRKPDSIRITGYTDEGDPIFRDLKFDGEIISYTYDNSNDKFGGRDKGRRTDTCAKISSEETAQGQKLYKVSGCKKNDPKMSYYLLRQIR